MNSMTLAPSLLTRTSEDQVHGALHLLSDGVVPSGAVWSYCVLLLEILNPLTPNDHYSGRTAPLASKRCILYIYSTNIGTEYFKHGVYSSFFSFRMQFVS